MIIVENITKTLLDKPLFNQASFALEAGERVGIVGPNGAGKSTLLAILASRIEADSGTVTYRRGADIAVLDQEVSFLAHETVASFLHRGQGRRISAYRAYYDLLTAEHTETQLAHALDAMERLGCWTLENEYTSLLTEMGLFDIGQEPMERLSGGMQKKVALARLLVSGADIFLLDEPTNHLDIPTIEWLEAQLKAHPATVVAVTHDRYFLDGVCDRILELDGSTLYVHPSPFSLFLQRRDERLKAQEREHARIKTILRRELAWLKRGPKARTTKDSGRVDRIEALLASEGPAQGPEIQTLSFLSRRLGKKILEAKDLSKSYSGTCVIDAFTHSFQKGCKIGVVGPNGSGKSTLLDLLSATVESDSGSLEIGVNTVFGYLRQTASPFDQEATIIDMVEEIAKVIIIGPKEQVSAAKMLELFGFPASMHRQKIGTLSGGEKRRLALVTTLVGEPNFLLLDEPTNDLDLAMMENLEEYLSSYGGCTLISSHDRAFLDLVCDELFVLDGSGSVTHHSQRYSEFKAAWQQKIPPAVAQEAAPAVARREAKKGLSWHEQKELVRLEALLQSLNDEITALEASFSTEQGAIAASIEERTRSYRALLAQREQTEEAWIALASRS